MKVSQELLQKIKASVNIVDIVGEHVHLRKSGSNHSGLCPFHSERTPSFSVSESKQLYHCYGCKKGGDLLGFVMEIYGISFPEAVEELADRAKIALPQGWEGADQAENPEVQKRRAAAREKASTAYRLNRFVAGYYHQMLGQLPEIERYFRTRGCGQELCRTFYMGGAPAAWDSLASYLVAKKAPLPLAVELGLIRPSQKNANRAGPGYFDLFRNRAMFPILDLRGKVAGFGGRTMPAPAQNTSPTGPEPAAGSPDSHGPKYMNSPESFTYQKSKLAFGLFQAQKHIREKDEVILVEGYFDVLALHAAGFENVVATCGTALTSDHLAIFRRIANRITILFDGDKAGISATERAMEIGLDNGIIVHGAVMPEGLDPDEILFDQKSGQTTPGGRERMESILKEARPLLDSRIEAAAQSAANGPEERTQALKQIGRWLARYRDPVGREVRLQSVEKRLGVDRRLLEKAMSGMNEGGPGRAAPVTPARPQPIRPNRQEVQSIPRWEEILIGAWVRGGNFSKLFTEAGTRLPAKMSLADLFESPALVQFASSFPVDTFESSSRTTAMSDFWDAIDHPKLRSLVTEAMVQPEPRFNQEELKTALDRAVGRLWARFSQQIKAAIGRAEANKNAELQATLMKEYLDVQRKMKEFSSFYDEA